MQGRLRSKLSGTCTATMVCLRPVPSSSTARYSRPGISPSPVVTCPSAVMLGRSEEHTSELQSQSNLVCRLLLEKKKKQTKQHFDGLHSRTDYAVYDEVT